MRGGVGVCIPAKDIDQGRSAGCCLVVFFGDVVVFPVFLLALLLVALGYPFCLLFFCFLP